MNEETAIKLTSKKQICIKHGSVKCIEARDDGAVEPCIHAELSCGCSVPTRANRGKVTTYEQRRKRAHIGRKHL